MLIHCFLDHGKQHFFHTQMFFEKIEHKGIIDVTYETKCSCKWIRAYNPCKYKTPNPSKTILKHHQFVLGFVAPKSVAITSPNELFFFLPWLLSMNSRFCHLIPKLLFPLSKQLQMCKLHMNIHGSYTINYVVFD